MNIQQIKSDNSQTVAIIDDGEALLFWGWPLCTRTSYRFIDLYKTAPRIIQSIQRFTPFMRSGKDRPVIEAEFADRLTSVEMGCGYMAGIDSHGNVFAWGDNYGG